MVQGYTSDSFDPSHVGQTDLQNMENNLECLRSNSSGANAPPSPVPAQWWADTTNSLMKVRNLADSAWLSLLNLATGALANSIVATASIMDLAITTGKLVDLCVTAAKLAANAVTTTKISDGAVTPAKLSFALFPNQVAGDILVHENDAEKTTNSLSWVKVKETTLGDSAKGILRIAFTMENNFSGQTAYGRIYRNGVPIGTTRSLKPGFGDDNTVTYTEDISGWIGGDTLQVFAYKSITSVFAVTISELKVYVNNPTWGTIVL